MNHQWTIMTDELNVSLNTADYTCIYTGISPTGKYLQQLITAYLQPRTKLKDEVRIYDHLDEADLTHQHYFAVPFSGADIMQEETLAAKSNMKQQVKEKLLNQLEGQGYLVTINSLIEDYLNMIEEDFDLDHQGLTVDDLIKQSTLNLSATMDHSDKYYEKYTSLLDKMVRHIPRKGASSPLLVLDHPENHLSAKLQIELHQKILEYSQHMKIMVFSSSVHFSGETWRQNNLINQNEEQILTLDFLEDLEWHAPMNYRMEDLEKSLNMILKFYTDKFEIVPVISNCRSADINVFSEMEIYTLIELLNKMNLQYDIDMDPSPLGEVIAKYIQKHEKR